MSTHVFRGGVMLLGPADASSMVRQLSMSLDIPSVDMTTISMATRSYAAGVVAPTYSADLIVDDAATWQAMFTSITGASGPGQPMVSSYYPNGAVAEGEPVVMWRANNSKIAHPWKIGDARAMTITGETTDLGLGVSGQSVARGYLGALKSAVATSGTGTGVQSGAMLSNRYGYVLGGHILAITGTAAITIAAQSANNSGFTGATTRLTTASLNSVTDFYVTGYFGATSDDWWRVSYTITGTGTVTFMANFARVTL